MNLRLETGFGKEQQAKRNRVRTSLALVAAAILVILLTDGALAQRFSGGFGRGEFGYPNADQVRTARESESHSTGTPNWTNDFHFAKDVFTFVRIRYKGHPDSGNNSYGGYRRRGRRSWLTDYPDSELNFSFRLQQMTSMKVDPDARVLDLTDPELFKYPWIYMVEPGGLYIPDDEVLILRRYLLNGGFLMLDDFWGEAEWANMEHELKKVFPERSFTELPMEHPIFHCVFDLKMTKNKLQVPNIRLGTGSQSHGITWEREDAKEVHIKAIQDDLGRIMAIACHNTDNGDGWEREGEDEYYFKTFSEKVSFPLGINIIFWAMTH
jgi:hypothetical protein